jgi:hypothetical protein
MGYSQHAGMVIVADGTDDAARRLERVLWNDPGTGVMRHADAGYDIAVDCARANRARFADDSANVQERSASPAGRTQLTGQREVQCCAASQPLPSTFWGRSTSITSIAVTPRSTGCWKRCAPVRPTTTSSSR